MNQKSQLNLRFLNCTSTAVGKQKAKIIKYILIKFIYLIHHVVVTQTRKVSFNHPNDRFALELDKA